MVNVNQRNSYNKINKSGNTGLCTITFKDGTTNMVEFEYVDDNWYEENSILCSIDYEMLCRCLRCDNFEDTIKTPHKIRNKINHLFNKSKNKNEHFFLSSPHGTVVFYKNKCKNSTSARKFINKCSKMNYGIEFYNIDHKSI